MIEEQHNGYFFWQFPFNNIQKNFIDTFVDLQDSLPRIEISSYLTRHLEGPATDCIPGFSLISKNYEEVMKLLEEQFGNTQAITSANMKVLLKLPKLKNKKPNKTDCTLQRN